MSSAINAYNLKVESNSPPPFPLAADSPLGVAFSPLVGDGESFVDPFLNDA